MEVRYLANLRKQRVTYLIKFCFQAYPDKVKEKPKYTMKRTTLAKLFEYIDQFLSINPSPIPGRPFDVLVVNVCRCNSMLAKSDI